MTDAFDLFVQYLCYSELFESSRACLRLGVGLATDITVLSNAAQELDTGARLFSLFSTAIFLLDRRAPTAARLAALFGHEAAHAILGSIFSRSADSYVARPRAADRLRALAPLFDAASRGAVTAAVEALLRVPRAAERPGRDSEFLAAVRKARAKPSALFVLEEASAPVKDRAGRNAIVASDREVNPGGEAFWSVGRREVRAGDAAQAILRRVALGAMFCEVDLEQLLLAAGITPALGRRDRRVVDFTVADLMQPGIVEIISEFVAAC
jgi:hypothetical protein